MSNLKVLRRRIQSVQNTRQITKAMELVAASKLKKIQKQAIAARLYGEASKDVLVNIVKKSDTSEHPYFAVGKHANKELLIIFASDKGLAGPFLTSLAHDLYAFVDAHQSSELIEVIVIGRRATRLITHLKGVSLIAAYDHFADMPEPRDFSSIFSLIDRGIVDGQYASITLIYSEFQSTSEICAKSLDLYPIRIQQSISPMEVVFDFEPSSNSVLTEASRLYIQSQLYRTKLASSASEYALRMMAMHNASDNAKDLIEEFKRELNASRQESITNQMAELSGALAALQS